ncbi:MAG: thioredoxin family protein [Chloroflexi bacterium]|nr:MAG: thioredoxin family protein [Chloroflexota bacterium]
MRVRATLTAVLAAAALAAVACGESNIASSSTASAVPGFLVVEAQNSMLLVGLDRVGVALFSSDRKAVNGATGVTLTIDGPGAAVPEQRPLEYIGPEYGSIPVYLGTARFPAAGRYRYVIDATLPGGVHATGQANVDVTTKSPSLPVGFQVPAARQHILGEPGVTLAQLDSGVPKPDDWHTATIADGLAQHRPMVLYFGQPGFCQTQTCGPTVQVLEKLCAQYCDKLLFEHIEVNFPAGPTGKAPENPVFTAFGFQSEPWVYFVNAQGVVADRFEGPVTIGELRSAADGTLAGHVPAVDVATG